MLSSFPHCHWNQNCAVLLFECSGACLNVCLQGQQQIETYCTNNSEPTTNTSGPGRKHSTRRARNPRCGTKHPNIHNANNSKCGWIIQRTQWFCNTLVNTHPQTGHATKLMSRTTHSNKPNMHIRHQQMHSIARNTFKQLTQH